MRRRCLMLLLALIGLLTFTDGLSAQSFRTRRTLRVLGHGYSDGYHRCQPLHDSSYYTPYTWDNSFLYSQTPEYQQFQRQRLKDWDRTQPPEFFGGVPFSIYAAPRPEPATERPKAQQPRRSQFLPASQRIPILNGSGIPIGSRRLSPPSPTGASSAGNRQPPGIARSTVTAPGR